MFIWFPKRYSLHMKSFKYCRNEYKPGNLIKIEIWVGIFEKRKII